MPKLHLKKGDIVKVISGDDKGKSGRIIEIWIQERKIMVEGVNIVTKHTKPTAQNTTGGRVQKEAAFNISNVMLVDPKSGLPTRVGRRPDEKGKLVRYSVRSKEEIK
ncbi:MAG: 50S ribosomal protein L24 [Bacteroidetes bacterium]|nr:50S ribosomal protein L24 [Bacteroidota bacterium]